MDNNFEEIYKKIISELNAEDIEKSKKIKLESKEIATLVLLFVMSLLTFSFPIFLAVLLIMYVIIISKKNRNKNQFFKQNVMTKIVKYYNDSFEYNANMGIGSAEYSKIWKEHYDRYYAEDDIKGILANNYSFEMSNVKAQIVSKDSKEKEVLRDIFSGIFAKINLPMDFMSELYICEKSRSIKDQEKIRMDSSEFEKHFKVYGQNKMVAFQLLTLDIMQMLIEYKEQSKIEFEMCIKNDKLYIRFFIGDVFELGMAENATNHDVIQKHYYILHFIVKLSEKLSNIIKEMQ